MHQALAAQLTATEAEQIGQVLGLKNSHMPGAHLAEGLGQIPDCAWPALRVSGACRDPHANNMRLQLIRPESAEAPNMPSALCLIMS